MTLTLWAFVDLDGACRPSVVLVGECRHSVVLDGGCRHSVDKEELIVLWVAAPE